MDRRGLFKIIGDYVNPKLNSWKLQIPAYSVDIGKFLRVSTDGKIVPEDVDTSLMKDVTYSELLSMFNGATLKPGMKYKVIDYKTVYKQEYTNILMEGDVDPIIVTATGTDTVSNEVLFVNYDDEKGIYDIGKYGMLGSYLAGRYTDGVDEGNDLTITNVTTNSFDTNNSNGFIYDNLKIIAAGNNPGGDGYGDYNASDIGTNVIITDLGGGSIRFTLPNLPAGVVLNDPLGNTIRLDVNIIEAPMYGIVTRRINTSLNIDIGCDYRAVKIRLYSLDYTNNIYNGSTTYADDDWVVSNNQIYYSTSNNNQGNTPGVTNSRFWSKPLCNIIDTKYFILLGYTSSMNPYNKGLKPNLSDYIDAYMFSDEFGNFKLEPLDSYGNAPIQNISIVTTKGIVFMNNSANNVKIDNTTPSIFYGNLTNINVHSLSNIILFNVASDINVNTLQNVMSVSSLYNIKGLVFKQIVSTAITLDSLIFDNIRSSMFSYGIIQDLIVNGEFYNNKIGGYIKFNNISDLFHDNIILVEATGVNDFNNNRFVGEFLNNIIINNTGSLSKIHNNLISSCSNNTINNSFYNNVSYGDFNNCNILDEFSNNIIKDNCTNNDFTGYTVYNEFNGPINYNVFDYLFRNVIYNECEYNDLPTTTLNSNTFYQFTDNSEINTGGCVIRHNRIHEFNRCKLGAGTIRNNNFMSEHAKFDNITMNGGSFEYNEGTAYISYCEVLSQVIYNKFNCNTLYYIKFNGTMSYNILNGGSFKGTSNTYKLETNIFTGNEINGNFNFQYTTGTGPVIGTGFNYNKLNGTFDITSGGIGNNFNYNVINSSITHCTIGNNFTHNKIDYPLTNIDFTGATHVFNDYNCHIIKKSDSSLALQYINGDNDTITTLITD